MTFNHLKMISRGKLVSFVPIAYTFFNRSVRCCGKGSLVGLPEAHRN